MKSMLLLALCVGALLGLFYLLGYPLAYYQFERLLELDPLYRQEVEEELFLYTARTIDIKESAWGNHFVLEPGQYCRQYLILGREPIDIVYDRNGRVVAKFSSFE